MVVISKYSQRADDQGMGAQMTVACTQLRQELKEVPRAQKWALAHAGVKIINFKLLMERR